MVIITEVLYPPESSMEMVKRFATRPALPDFLTAKGPYFSSEKGEGVRALTIYEFDQAKLSDAIQFAAKGMVTYYGVPGFTYSVKPWIDVQEGMKLIS